MSDDASELFAQHGLANNVDPLMMQAIAQVESQNRNYDDSGNPVVSPTGAKGRMQFTGVGTPGGTAYRYGVSNPFDDNQSIPAASKLMSDNLDAAKGDVGAALKSYNGGGDPQYASKVFAAWRGLQNQQQPHSSAGSTPVANPAPATNDAFWNSLGAKQEAAPPVATSAAPVTAPATPDSDSFWSGLGDKSASAPVVTTQPADAVSGIGNSILRGVHEATDVPAHALASGADYVAGKLGYQTHFAQDSTDAAQPFNQAYDANPDNKGIGPAIGRLAGNAAITIPAAIGGGNYLEAGLVGASRAVPAATSVLRMAAPVLSGAAQGATVAGMTGDPVGPSALLGGGLGAAGGVVGAGINGLIGSPSPGVQTLMTKYGVPLRAGQTSDNQFVRKLDQMVGQLPFSGRAAENEAQVSATNNAIGQTFGADVPKVTDPVMASAQARIGGVMNRVENANTVKIGDSAVSQLANIESNARSSMEDSEFKVIKRQLDNVMSKIGDDGTIAGTTYGDMIGHGSPLDAATKSQNSNVANYANQIKSTLQDSLYDSLSPADAAAYGDARLQYKNMMTVAPLVNKGKPGDISPLLLQGAANRSFKDGWRSGRGDLGEIADLAQTYLRPPADSGTPLGNAILGGFWAPAAAAGRMVAGATAGKLASTITGANPLTGYAGPTGLGRAILPGSVLLRNNQPQQPQ